MGVALVALLEQKHFTWRDVLVFALILGVTFVGIRAERKRAALTQDNHNAAVLVASAVCQQSGVLISASLAKKTPAQRAELKPLVTQYLVPLNRALTALGHEPCLAPPG